MSQFIPPWQDCATLCAHICISKGTLENWIRLHGFPPGRMRGGKRVWRWADVDRWLSGEEANAETDIAERVRHATREAISGR